MRSNEFSSSVLSRIDNLLIALAALYCVYVDLLAAGEIPPESEAYVLYRCGVGMSDDLVSHRPVETAPVAEEIEVENQHVGPVAEAFVYLAA